MLNGAQILTAAAAVALTVAASPSFAATVTYDFDSVSGDSFGSGGASTSVVVGNATFTQANASTVSYAFYFGPNGGLFSNIDGGAGTVLSTAGYAGANPAGAPASLTISFSSTVIAVSFDFANSDFFGLNGGDALTATIDGIVVATANPTFPTNGDLYDEGAFSYSNSNGFNSITLTSTDSLGAEDLVLGDLTATTTPLPAALPLFATGLTGLGLFGLRRKKKTASLASA